MSTPISLEQCYQDTINNLKNLYDGMEKRYKVLDEGECALKKAENEFMEKFGIPSNFFVDLESKMQEATSITRGLPVKKVSYHAQQWEPGAFAGFHSDNSTDGSYNAFERSKCFSCESACNSCSY